MLLIGRWEAAMGSGVSIVPAVGGDFVEEEDEECWLVTMGSGVSVVPDVGTGHENGVGMGSRVDIGASVGGDFIEEEDGKCWLVTGVFSFRRRASSL